MSDIEITPAVLRAVAGLFDLEDSKPEFVSTALREKAVLLERKQADEKRVHELARVFFRAARPTANPWDSQPEGLIRPYLNGTRALLAKLDEEANR